MKTATTTHTTTPDSNEGVAGGPPVAPNRAARRSRKRTRRLVASGLAVLIGAGSLALAPGAGAEPVGRPNPITSTIAPPGSPSIPGIESEVGAESIPTWIAEGIISTLAGKGTELLLNQLGRGDNTPQQLEKVLAELANIQNRMDEMQTRLAQIAAMNHYSSEVNRTNDVRSRIDASLADLLSVGQQAVVVRDLQKQWAEAGTPEDREDLRRRLDVAEADYHRRVETFKENFRSRQIDVAVRVLNKELTPQMGATDLVKSYRNVLLAHVRYITNKESNDVRAVYGFFENYQAMAALLWGEYNAATEQDNKPVAELFKGFTQTQRSLLPPMVPNGAVIDLGQHAQSTQNKTMWTGLHHRYHGHVGDSWWDGTQRKLAEVNRENLLGRNQWRLPTGAEADALFDGWDWKGSSAAHLRKMGLPIGDGEAFWVGDTVIQRPEWRLMNNTPKTIGVRTYTARTMADGDVRADASPKLPGAIRNPDQRHGRWENQNAVGEHINREYFQKTQNRILAATSTGTTNYL